MLVTLQGDKVTVEVDGTVTTTFDSSSPNLPARKSWSEPILAASAIAAQGEGTTPDEPVVEAMRR